MKKGVPPPKLQKNRIPPPPPVPKMPVITPQEQHQQTPTTTENQQKLDVQIQHPNPLPNQGKIEPIVTDKSTNSGEQPKGDIQIPLQKDQMMQSQFDMSQQVPIGEVKKTTVELKTLSVMKGVPPPIKSRPGNLQDKKRVGLMKIPAPTFVPKKEEQAPQQHIEVKKEQQSIVNRSAQITKLPIQGVKNPQISQSGNQTKIQNTVSTLNETPIQEQPQKGIPEPEPNLENNKTQINPQLSSSKKPLPPTFKPGNKKVVSQIKAPMKPTMITQNANTQIQSIPTLKNEEKKIQSQKLHKQEKQVIQKTSQVLAPKQNITNAEKQSKATIKSNYAPVTKDVSPQSASQYNELQQKLRRLQQLRSKMAQSSEESDSYNQDEIQEQAEQQNQQDELYQQEKQEFRQEKVVSLEQKQFAIGETNYDEMEINEEAQCATPEVQTKNIKLQQQQTLVIEKQDELNNNEGTISPHQEQFPSFIPVPDQTVYESNLSIDQSHRQYLPDQLSISPLNSQQSMAKHHPQVHQDLSTNNVYHADKYRSQANIYKSKQYPEYAKQDMINEKPYNGAISQKSDTQLQKLKHHEQNQQHYKIRDPSNQTAFDRQSQLEMKENKQPKTKPYTQKLKKKSTETSVDELLRQFRAKKSQYLQNIENLKLKQAKFEETEGKYRERINQLMNQVNHKNLLLLKHSTGLTDITLQNDNQITQTEQL